LANQPDLVLTATGFSRGGRAGIARVGPGLRPQTRPFPERRPLYTGQRQQPGAQPLQLHPHNPLAGTDPTGYACLDEKGDPECGKERESTPHPKPSPTKKRKAGDYGHASICKYKSQFCQGIDYAKARRLAAFQKQIDQSKTEQDGGSSEIGGQAHRGNGAITAAFSWAYNDEGHTEGKKKGAPISDEEWELLKKGDYIGFWRSRYAADDPVARTALIGWGYGDEVSASSLEKLAARYAWRDLQDYIEDNGLNVTMDEIALELANMHARYVNLDDSGIHHLLSAKQVADYHHKVFADYGIPRYIFGGTMRIIPFPKMGRWEPPTLPDDAYAFFWCEGCDSTP
jgi:hypothetical protein